MSLCATAVGRPDLRSVDIDRMFEIYSACYQDTCRARFEQDLDDKTHCVVLRDTHDTIMGFTTLKLFEMSWDNQPCKFIFPVTLSSPLNTGAASNSPSPGLDWWATCGVRLPMFPFTGF